MQTVWWEADALCLIDQRVLPNSEATVRCRTDADVANKIGTYSLAILAQAHGIPFYVAAPTSTIDLSLATGDDIPIEHRSADEVTHFGGQRLAPGGVHAADPAFDVTPPNRITAIITEQGVIEPPFVTALERLRYTVARPGTALLSIPDDEPAQV